MMAMATSLIIIAYGLSLWVERILPGSTVIERNHSREVGLVKADFVLFLLYPQCSFYEELSEMEQKMTNNPVYK